MTRVFEIWQYAGKVYGNERVHLPPSQSVRGFEFTYDFRGKSAHFVIVTHDRNLSADIALEFAASIHAGKYINKRVSFDEINADMERYRDLFPKRGKR